MSTRTRDQLHQPQTGHVDGEVSVDVSGQGTVYLSVGDAATAISETDAKLLRRGLAHPEGMVSHPAAKVSVAEASETVAFEVGATCWVLSHETADELREEIKAEVRRG